MRKLAKNKQLRLADLGAALAAARKAAGLDQAAAAAAVGVHVQTWSRWERGRLAPGADLLHAACVVLDVSADVLLGLRRMRGS